MRFQKTDETLSSMDINVRKAQLGEKESINS